MADIYIKDSDGGETTTLSNSDGFPVDTGTTSPWIKASNLAKYVWNYLTSLTAKTSLVDADQLGISDSAASNVGKKITWANVMTAILAYTGTLTNKTINLTSNTLTATSAQMRTAISDETGTGVAVFNDTPTIITPTIASFANATHNHKSAAGGGQINTYLSLQINAPATSVADATTYYIGNESVFTTTEAQHSPTIVPIAGTIIAVYVSIRNNTPGSAETSTIYLRINETTDIQISNSVVNNAAINIFSVTGLSQAVSEGDRLRGKWITPTWATDPASVNMSFTILMTTSVV